MIIEVDLAVVAGMQGVKQVSKLFDVEGCKVPVRRVQMQGMKRKRKS